MHNYLVATIHPWNIEMFQRYSKTIPGNWHLVTKPEELTVELVDQLEPKYIFFPHWSWLVSKELLKKASCVCFHMTDLPFGRGGSPLQNLIIRGFEQTQLTALKMTEELDAGPIYLKRPLSLAGSAEQIFTRAAKEIAVLITDICERDPLPQAQQGEVTTFARRTPEQSEIPKHLSTKQRYDFIRMLDAPGYPKAFTIENGKKIELYNAKLNNGILEVDTHETDLKPEFNSGLVPNKVTSINKSKIQKKSVQMTKHFADEVIIDYKKIGNGHAPYIIAELSANHNGDINKALATIDMAKAMGADAIKIQTYTADTMTINCDNEYFQIEGGLWHGYNLHELYKWAETPYEWHQAIFEHAKKIGITLFSTPFDESAIDLLESLDCPAYKIASFEATDLPLIEKAAKTGKPLIISTGMANEQEIDELVATVKQAGGNQLILLHCISSYPAPVEQSNLHTIADINERWQVLSGLSDHTLGTSVAITSVALGACLIEKHVTLDRNDKGPDSEFSLEPNELKQLVNDSKQAWLSLGKAGYEHKEAELANLKFRRSVFFVEDIKQGEIITEKHIRRIRPGFGLPPKYYSEILGKKAATDITRGTPTSWELIES